jgi:hypothetical protein
MNNFTNLLKIQSLKNKIKIYKELVLKLESTTLSYGYSDIPVIGSMGSFSCDLIKAVQDFFNQSKFLNDKIDYDNVNAPLINIENLLIAFIDKANDILKILKNITDILFGIDNDPSELATQLVKLTDTVNNLQYNYDASENCFSINSNRKCNPYVGGEPNNVIFEFLISPDKNSDVCGYDVSLNELIVENANLDLSYNLVYSDVYTSNEYNKGLNTNNLEKIIKFIKIVSNNLRNIKSYLGINNTDQDKTASEYESYKNELVNKLNNKINSLELELNLRAYDNNKLLPFMGI